MPSFGNINFPPSFLKKKKEEDAPTLAEAPEALPLDLATAPSEEIEQALADYANAWQERLRQHNVYSFSKGENPMASLNESTAKIRKLLHPDVLQTSRIGAKNGLNIKSMQSGPLERSENRDASVDEVIRKELEEINATLPERFEALTKENDSRNPESTHTRQMERDQVLKDLLDYQNEWSKKIVDASLQYTNQDEIRAFAQTRSEATDLANAYAASTSPEEWTALKEKLDRKVSALHGARTKALEKAIRDKEKSSSVPVEDATPKEMKQANQEAISQIESLSGNIVLAAAESGASRMERREARAAAFAEKHGIAETRAAMLEAEKEYKQALSERQKKHIRFPWKGIDKETQRKYDSARLEWLTAIRGVQNADGLSDREKAEAHIIGKRDTLLREEAARQDAYLEGADHRSKSAAGKAIAWAGLHAMDLPKAYIGIFNQIGKGIALAEGKFTKDEKYDAEAAAKKYARASRIIGTAAISTIVFGGIGSAGVGVSIVLRMARGTLGIFGGSKLGFKFDSHYEKNVDEGRRTDLRDAERANHMTAKDLRRAEKVRKKGTLEARQNERKLYGVLGALIGGGGISALTEGGLHLMDSIPAVHNAAVDIGAIHEQVAQPVDSEVYTPAIDLKSVDTAYNDIKFTDLDPNHADFSNLQASDVDSIGQTAVHSAAPVHHATHSAAARGATPVRAPERAPETATPAQPIEAPQPVVSETPAAQADQVESAPDVPAATPEMTETPAAPVPQADELPQAQAEPVSAPEQPVVASAEATPAAAPESLAPPVAAPETGYATAPMDHVPDDILQRPLPEYNPVDYPNTPLGPEHIAESPQAPDHAIAPEHTTPNADEVVVRAQTITVDGHQLDLRTPHIVESSVGNGSPILIGGTPEERLAATKRFFENPANNAKDLYVEGVGHEMNPATGKPFLDKFFHNEDGVLVREPNLRIKHGGFLGLFAKTDFSSVPDPKTFTKVIE